jgi:hypothetical protein
MILGVLRSPAALATTAAFESCRPEMRSECDEKTPKDGQLRVMMLTLHTATKELLSPIETPTAAMCWFVRKLVFCKHNYPTNGGNIINAKRFFRNRRMSDKEYLPTEISKLGLPVDVKVTKGYLGLLSCRPSPPLILVEHCGGFRDVNRFRLNRG